MERKLRYLKVSEWICHHVDGPLNYDKIGSALIQACEAAGSPVPRYALPMLDFDFLLIPQRSGFVTMTGIVFLLCQLKYLNFGVNF